MDIQVLIERVTAEVIKSLGRVCKPKVTIVSNHTEEKLKELFKDDFELIESDCSTSDYIVLSKEKYEALISAKPFITTIEDHIGDSCIDFTSKKVITQRDLREVNGTTIKTIQVKKATIITALAKDMLKELGITIELL